MKLKFKLFHAGFLLFFISLIACSPNNVTKDDSLKKYFDEQQLTGCFALMDNGTGKFSIHNLITSLIFLLSHTSSNH